LFKECQPSATVRKRKTANRVGTLTKTARLEQKLDGLVSLLKTATQLTPLSVDSPNAFTVLPQNRPVDGLEQSLSNLVAGGVTRPRVSAETEGLVGGNYARNTLSEQEPMLTPTASYTTSASGSVHYHSPEASPSRASELSVEDADASLEIFRTQMMCSFPFAPVSASTTAQDLRNSRPFLWLCIMAVSSKSTPQREALGKEIRLTLGRKLFIEGESRLDLLLGILTYVIWCVLLKLLCHQIKLSHKLGIRAVSTLGQS
jgi:hypothetical protein